MTSAETAYLFRHALMRDAAYQLQPPGDRGKLHALAFFLIEEAFGGRAPEPAPLTASAPPEFAPHPTDAAAVELVYHARASIQQDAAAHAVTPGLLRRYLRRAAEHAERAFLGATSAAMWQQLADLTQGADSGEALRRAAFILHQSGRMQHAEERFEQASAVFRQHGDRRGEGVTSGNLAVLYSHAGRLEKAEQTIQLALDVLREVGARRIEGAVMGELAVLYARTGRMEQAEQ